MVFTMMQPLGPAKNAGSGTRTFLVANDGGGLQGPSKGLPEVLCIGRSGT